MFETKKFLQAVGLSLLISVVVSTILGLVQFEHQMVFLIIQMLSFYGTMGFFAVVFNPKTPFIASYLGALIIAMLNILFANFVFGIWMFVNPTSINNILSFAVLTALSVTSITLFIKNRSGERFADV
ncbi:hypothetical protein MHZ92_08800 [Sporosarcina sp. ACRSL]|uniref:hypothetical protein n=1 Tax=Sporosarcina sp. ACRSL TaxID=2918215 RepID=UPI001EF6CBF5|nr:hypothetical protein [Sporosarcina sp. ACRSL]MCG7344230.1 hypothetical protein [Sporosarcina sp. ACRSL]